MISTACLRPSAATTPNVVSYTGAQRRYALRTAASSMDGERVRPLRRSSLIGGPDPIATLLPMLRNIDAAAVATAFRPSRGRTCDPAAAQYAGARAGVGIEDAGLSGRDPVLAVTELYAHAAA